MSNAVELDVLSEVLKLIESTLKIPADRVDIDADLESFGVNSLIVMELMENIEKELDLILTPTQFSSIGTVREMADLLESLMEKETGAVDRAHYVASEPRATPAAVQSMPAGLQPATLQPLRSRGGDSPSRHVLDYVNRTFAIDLSQRDFDSVEDIVDALISDHADDLVRHYGLGEAGRHAFPAGHERPAKAPLVAIVGMSCRLPDAPDPRAFWENLVAQKNSVREIPKSRWNWEDYYAETVAPGKTVSKWGALIDDVDCFDAGFFAIPSEEAATIDPQLRLLIEETFHAVEDAGIDMTTLAGSRTGVFIGYEYAEYEQRLRKLANQDFNKGPLFSSSSPSYYLSNRISHIFDLCGPSESFNVNCASSAVAINRAYHSLVNGESHLAIAGAASLNLFADDYVAASQYGVLSPNGTSGVFDDAANGFTRGEGVATVALKRLEDAERNNDRVYGLIRSCHENFRGAARNISEVKHESITEVLGGCYEKAGIEPDTVRYIEVDGYASKWADSFEYEGVKAVFASGVDGKRVALGSMKGNIGNVEPVSGVASVIKIALSLYHNRFPATISKKTINTFIDIDSPGHPLYIADREIPFDTLREDAYTPIRAGVNSFADSGANVHILLEEYTVRRPVADEPASKQVFVLSAKDGERLERYIQRYLDFLSGTGASAPWVDLVYTAQAGREALGHRLAIVASSREELLEKLLLVQKTGIKNNLGLDAKGIYYGSVDGAEKSPLAGLITAEMARMQLTQSLQSGQWRQIALLWVNGVVIPWEVMWRDKVVQRTSLPTYPFAKDRHWLDIEVQEEAPREFVASSSTAAAADVSQPISPPEIARWYFYRSGDAATPEMGDAAISRAQKIELFLRQEVAAQLRIPIERVALDRDFIDLGMSSIAIADLIIKTDRLLGSSLSPSVLFKHPEIGTLSNHLAGTYAEAIDALRVSQTEPPADATSGAGAPEPLETVPTADRTAPLDILIPVQGKGGKPPIFAVPGAGGNALSMQQLSRALGDEQPLYCLEPIGLDGRMPPMTRVEEIAEFNIEAMRSVQANGPYRLLGYSNGGIVAFEMARRLLEQGEAIAALTMLDSLAPPLLERAPIEVMTVAVFNHFIGSLGGVSDLDVDGLRRVPERERSEYLYQRVVDLGIDLPKQQFVATFEVATASELGCRRYRPKKLPDGIDVVLFRATNAFDDMPSDYGWGDLVAGAIQTRAVKGDHFTILEKGPVGKIAKNLTPATKKASPGRARSTGDRKRAPERRRATTKRQVQPS